MSSPVKLAFFNVIGTLNPQYNPYDYLHRQLDLMDESLIYAEKFQNRPLSEEQWHKLEAKLWAGQDLKRVLRELGWLPWLPGAREVAALLREASVKIVLISSGFDLQAALLAEAVGAAYTFANELCVDGEALTGEVVFRVRDAQKGALVDQVMAQEGAHAEECIAFGCTLYDTQMFERVGWSVAVDPYDDRVKDKASVTLSEPNLTPVLPLLAARLHPAG